MNKRAKRFVPLHKLYTPKTVIRGDEAITRLYDRVWQHYREIFLKINPRCYCCGAEATVVDHLIPHRGDVSLFWREDNYLPLCKKHHDLVTNNIDRFYRTGQGIQNKAEYLSGFRFINEVTFKVKVVPFDEKVVLHKLNLLGNLKKERG